MIDIETIKTIATEDGEINWSSKTVLELITRLESAELFVERTAKAESTLINDLSAYVEVLEAKLQKAEQDANGRRAALSPGVQRLQGAALSAGLEGGFVRGRIKIGACISHDFGFGNWPSCKAPKGSKDPDCADDPDMLFEMEWTGRMWNCTAPGFGAKEWYGNGGVSVYGPPPANAKLTGGGASD